MKEPLTDRAFILAAGNSTRMRPLTDHMPKPLAPIGGRPMIDYILDSMKDAGIARVDLNVHYKADMMRAHLGKYSSPRIFIHEEAELLDTGGGLKNMLGGLSGDDPVICINGDSFWTENAGGNVFTRLMNLWDSSRMDMLSILQPTIEMKLTSTAGDYDLAPDGKVVRHLEKKGAYIWTNIRICRAGLFENTPPVGTKFSFLELMDRAQENGRHFGIVHEGAWYNINSMSDRDNVDRALYGRKA